MYNKKKITLFGLILAIFFNHFTNIFSQCDNTLTITPAFTCEEAENSYLNGAPFNGFVCNLEGFCFNTGVIPQLNPPIAFCAGGFALNNPIWFSFVTDGSGFIDFNITPTNCTGGNNAVQWALYSDCGNLFNAIGCDGDVPPGVPFQIAANVPPNTVVYLVIDGSAGTVCDYEFHVDSGLTPTFVVPNPNAQLVGKINVCPGYTGNYSFDGFDFATNYEWTFDGQVLADAGASTTITIPDGTQPGIYDLTANGVNDCDLTGQQITWQINVIAEVEINKIFEVCEGELATFKNKNYGVGIYDFIIRDVQNNSCDTMVHLEVNEIPPAIGPPLISAVCPGEDFFTFEGEQYYASINPNTISYISSRGCDSTVELYVLPIDFDNIVVTSNPDRLPCGGGGMATLSVTGFPVTFQPPITYSYRWLGPANQNLGATQNINVTAPGVYRVIITTQINNPNTLHPELLDLTCQDTFSVTVGATNSTLIPPELLSQPIICAGQMTNVQITNTFPAGTTFNWNAIGGNITGPNNNTSINVTYPTAGTFQVIVGGIDGCGPGPLDTIIISITPSPRIDAIQVDNDTICGKSSDLTASISGFTNVNDTLNGYNWTVLSGPNPAGVTFSNPNNSTTQVSVTDYGTYQFELKTDYDGRNCGDAETITLVFEEQLVINTTDAIACNAINQANPNIINLNSLLTSNIPYTGTWTLLSGAPAPGGSSDIPDFTGLPGNQIYVFEFTPNRSGICGVAAVNVTINLENCICPILNILPANTDFCNEANTIIDLQDYVGVGTAAGSWLLTQEPAGSTVSYINNTTINIAGTEFGTYEFTYSLDNPDPQCNSTGVLLLNIVEAPFAELKNGITCNADPSNTDTDIIDFSTLITGGQTNGVWTYSGNIPATDPSTGGFSAKNFNGVQAGIYEYTYTVTGNPACQPVSYTIEIDVDDDCACLPTTTERYDLVCNTNVVIDLNLKYKITNQAGSWRIENPPVGSTAIIQNGNELNLNNTPAGLYNFIFTLDNQNVGCNDTSLLIINVDQKVNPGSDVSLSSCIGIPNDVKLDDVLISTFPTGTWKYLNTNGALTTEFEPVSSYLYSDQLQSPGIYSFGKIIPSPFGACPNDTAFVHYTINPNPIADAGLDATLTCNTPSTILGGTNSSTGQDISYTWLDSSGNTIASTSTIQNFTNGGTFTLYVEDTKTGCKNEDNVNVNIVGNIITAIQTSVDSINCFNEDDGYVEITGIVGGTPPYTYTLNGASNPGPYTNLSAGNYEIEVTDVNGCKQKNFITLKNPEVLEVDLGNPFVLIQGTDSVLTANLSPINTVVDEISWTASTEEPICSDCPSIQIAPEITTTYDVNVINLNGCIASDEILVTVQGVIRIFVPNVFTPNNDSVNDEFYFSTDNNVKLIRSLYIYNRWGDVLYSALNFPPNDPSFGWNGKFGGKENIPGVYIYWAEIEFIDGRTDIIKGDITLMR